MQFFQLIGQNYSTDQNRDRANPIKSTWLYSIPGLRCPVCRITWTGRRESYLPLPHGFNDQRFYKPAPLKEEEWIALADEARKIFGLPATYKFEPGDGLGIPEYLVGKSKSDVFFGTGTPLTNRKVAEFIESAGLTGVKMVKVLVRWGRHVKDTSMQLPDFYAMNVEAIGWRQSVELRSITACSHCGRRTFDGPDNIVIDEERWDGSDVFMLDMNPAYVIVTERVKRLFEEQGFHNCCFGSLGSTGECIQFE